MRKALMVSVWGAVFVILAYIVLISLQAGSVGAQTDDPLEGQTANITATTIGPIAVAGCEADPDATEVSVTVADADENEATFTDGDAEIQFGPQEVTITARGGGNLDPQNLVIGAGTVVSSAGIICGNAPEEGGVGNVNPAENQYEREDVILKTVPDKPLPKTGGTSLVLGAGALLALATLLSIRVLRP